MTKDIEASFDELSLEQSSILPQNLRQSYFKRWPYSFKTSLAAKHDIVYENAILILSLKDFYNLFSFF